MREARSSSAARLRQRRPASARSSQAVPTRRRRPRRPGHRTCAASTRWATWPPSPTTRQATSTRTVPTSAMEHSPEVDATT